MKQRGVRVQKGQLVLFTAKQYSVRTDAEMRRLGYGMQIRTMTETFGWSKEEAERITMLYHEGAPFVKATMDRVPTVEAIRRLPEIQEAMEHTFPISVPIRVDPEVGRDWGRVKGADV
jgi:DNA polymerase I-like protein with 3'-5' exonuclease and polymerase domains